MNSAVRAGCSAVQNSRSSKVLFSASISRSSGRKSVLTMLPELLPESLAERAERLPIRRQRIRRQVGAETVSIGRIAGPVKGEEGLLLSRIAQYAIRGA